MHSETEVTPRPTRLDDSLSTFQHDARTPLNVVLGYAQLMRTSPLPPEAHAQIDAILHAGQDLLRLLDDLESRTR